MTHDSSLAKLGSSFSLSYSRQYYSSLGKHITILSVSPDSKLTPSSSPDSVFFVRDPLLPILDPTLLTRHPANNLTININSTIRLSCSGEHFIRPAWMPPSDAPPPPPHACSPYSNLCSDLECDYLNPIDLCNKLNQVRTTLLNTVSPDHQADLCWLTLPVCVARDGSARLHDGHLPPRLPNHRLLAQRSPSGLQRQQVSQSATGPTL